MIKRLETPHGRVYAYSDKSQVILMPSVTTILGSETNNYIQELENSMGKEKLEQLGKKAALRGTAMHSFLENYFICLQHKKDHEKSLLYTQKKTPIDLADSLPADSIKVGRELFYNFVLEDTFSQVKDVVFTEKLMYSLTHRFAGTGDFAFINEENELVFVDFKSASGYRNEETVNKYKKQIAAYALAYEEIHKQAINEGQIWISSVNGLQLERVGYFELQEYKQQFIDLAKRFHQTWNEQPFREYLGTINH